VGEADGKSEGKAVVASARGAAETVIGELVRGGVGELFAETISYSNTSVLYPDVWLAE
jgi:hypothetical protein